MELLIVGLDGLSVNMLDRFDVSTPFLDEVRSAGVSGDLRSVDPPTTLPAWTSFATGKDPGTHGVQTMLQQGADYEIDPATPNTDDAALYDLLDDAVLVNLPASANRTPAGADVHLVSSILATDADEAIPPELASVDAASDYVVHGDTTLQSEPEAYLEHLLDVTAARWRFASEAFDRQSPRAGFVLFSTPDWVGHFLQHAPDEATAGEWYRTVVERVDEYVGQLAAGADNLLLLSDHGFEPKDRSIHLQTWLTDEGYIDVQEADRSIGQRLATGVASFLAQRFQPGYDLARSVYVWLNDASNGSGVEDLVDMNPDLDFPNATAWHLRYGCCYVNDARFEHPTVDDPAAARRELRDALAELTDEDGTPIFSDVLLAEAAYEDPEQMAPDVVARPADGYLPMRALSPTGSFVREFPSDTFHDHRYEGLIAARGPLFASEATVEGAGIVDVLPTILHALGEPIPSDVDGEVQPDLLATSVAPTTIDERDVPEPAFELDRGATSETVTGRLEDLGYLE